MHDHTQVDLTTNRDLAYYLASMGIPVFPCHSFGKKRKSPLVSGGFRSATTDSSQIREWWRLWPNAAPGIPVPKNVVVLDTDAKGDLDGEFVLKGSGLHDAAEQSTIIVRTPTGGTHRWFSVDETESFSNTSSVNGLQGVDLRVAGKGYVFPPGTVLDIGCYTAVVGGLTELDVLDPMPSILVEALSKSILPPVPPPSVSGHNVPPLASSTRKRLEALARTITTNIASTVIGLRHTRLLGASRTLGGYLHYGAFTRNECELGLIDASRMNRHIEDDGIAVVIRAIRDGLDHGERTPLRIDDRPRTSRLPTPFTTFERKT